MECPICKEAGKCIDSRQYGPIRKRVYACTLHAKHPKFRSTEMMNQDIADINKVLELFKQVKTLDIKLLDR